MEKTAKSVLGKYYSTFFFKFQTSKMANHFFLHDATTFFLINLFFKFFLVTFGRNNPNYKPISHLGCSTEGVKAYFSPCRCFLALSSSSHLLSGEMRLKQLH